MNNVQLVKKNNSSMQVLKTLKALLDGDYTMSELVEKLNKTNLIPTFNSSTVSKYINTCRYCNIEILKIQNRYCLSCLPFGYTLSEADASVFTKLHEIAKNILSYKLYVTFTDFIRKIARFSNKSILRIEKRNLQIAEKIFNQALEDKKNISFILKNKETITGTPIEIIKGDDKVLFSIEDSIGKKKQINLNKIAGIEIYKQNLFKDFNTNNGVVYRLTGDLAKRYSIREFEHLLKVGNDEIVIANYSEEKCDLLSRLLRYDKSCEIISPKSYREEMLKILTNALKNYEDDIL